jgi:hypothetical protein
VIVANHLNIEKSGCNSYCDQQQQKQKQPDAGVNKR